MEKKIILISGHAGAGKTTLANAMKLEFHAHGVDAEVVSFADNLKSVAKLLGWNTRKDTRGRKLLIDLGKVLREYNEDTWVSFVYNRIEDLFDDDVPVVLIDDWRYKNEFSYFYMHGYDDNLYPIRIKRDENKILSGTQFVTDQSEIDLDDFIGYYNQYDNRGTMKDLNLHARNLVESLLEE